MTDFNDQFQNPAGNGQGDTPIVPEDRPQVFTPPTAPVADMPTPATAEPQPYRVDAPQQTDAAAAPAAENNSDSQNGVLRKEFGAPGDDAADGNVPAQTQPSGSTAHTADTAEPSGFVPPVAPAQPFESSDHAAFSDDTAAPTPADPSQYELKDDLYGDRPAADTAVPRQNVMQTPLTMPVQGLTPVEVKTPTQKEKRGVKVFAVVLAIVLALTAGMGAGYILGKDWPSNGGKNTPAPVVTLEKKPDNGAESTVESIYKVVSPSIVKVYVYNEKGFTQSSGVIYSSDGYIVTNDHIYESLAAPTVLIELKDGTQYDARFIAGDSRSDLSVLKIEATGLTAAKFGDSDALVVGETVIAIGNPDNAEVATATTGIVSAVNTWVSSSSQSGSNYAARLIQTDAALNPGSSGGALVNAYGQVVGITSSKIIATDYDLINYAIPTTVMQRVVDSLIKDGYVTGRSKLGITYNMVDKLASKVNDLPCGLYVQSVTDDSDLKGKASKGDIITHINGEEVTSSSVVLSVLENTEAGNDIQLTIYYGSSKKSGTVSVKLVEDRGSSHFNSKPETVDDNPNEFSFPFGD